jgi:hypothetical protein
VNFDDTTRHYKKFRGDLKFLCYVGWCFLGVWRISGDMGADASAEPALLQPRIVVFRAPEKTCVLLRGGGDVFTIPGNVVASMAKVMGVCEDSSG